ncbi:DUF6460 domain-containing protein [Dichotomicrobium thermohalophilum]|uniref:DUF6460 domain-containing protein n=1 Tax=Dichotomicrobium thermohalophilum TaxID=933063 RepID=A0A397Q4F1_9HYPH|nr:DUF6460 domain-containing protein [Dichotomicrobium thermohalophilum]RIA55813.1 hypothetical protein BXY53_0896 [Dichotomicrobium thermohalophilum]
MDRFAGSHAAGVALRLAIISIVVGIVLQALDLNPLDLVENIRALIRYVSEVGLDALEWLGTRLLIGAVVVVPIWAVVQIFRLIFRRTSDGQ